MKLCYKIFFLISVLFLGCKDGMLTSEVDTNYSLESSKIRSQLKDQLWALLEDKNLFQTSPTNLKGKIILNGQTQAVLNAGLRKGYYYTSSTGEEIPVFQYFGQTELGGFGGLLWLEGDLTKKIFSIENYEGYFAYAPNYPNDPTNTDSYILYRSLKGEISLNPLVNGDFSFEISSHAIQCQVENVSVEEDCTEEIFVLNAMFIAEFVKDDS